MTDKSDKTYDFTSKRCPDCFKPMPLNFTKCPYCGLEVGPVTEKGLAKRLVNVKSYLMCIGSWGVFALYIWWAFFK